MCSHVIINNSSTYRIVEILPKQAVQKKMHLDGGKQTSTNRYEIARRGVSHFTRQHDSSSSLYGNDTVNSITSCGIPSRITCYQIKPGTYPWYRPAPMETQNSKDTPQNSSGTACYEHDSSARKFQTFGNPEKNISGADLGPRWASGGCFLIVGSSEMTSPDKHRLRKPTILA